MRILLLHPEDSPRRGPWTSRKWDLIVDLGKCSESAAAAWQDELRCPVLRLESFRQGTEDLRTVHRMLRSGHGRLLDAEGLDWWDLTGLLIHPELETAILLRRLAPELAGSNEFHASRPGWPIAAMAVILGCDLQAFGNTTAARAGRRLNHYRCVLRTFPIAQLTEIFFDKYDSHYNWRRIFAPRRPAGGASVVLLPTAYTNVSRMAAAYACMLPDQQFLLVATRRSGMLADTPPNVRLATLASYGGRSAPRLESADILQKWQTLQTEMRGIPEIELLCSLGRLDEFPQIFRQGLAVRDAWRTVLEREPVSSVLCGDDSNPYTRLPVLLARKRCLPTLDFHHGALDGRFLVKDLPSDLYLAKSEMEHDYLQRVCHVSHDKIALGAPTYQVSTMPVKAASETESQIVFFSEPYESAGGRGEEVYRELVPALARLAHQAGRKLIIKLHPFESVSGRSRLVQQVLPAKHQATVEIISGLLSRDLLLKTWFGITVESSTVLDCTLQRIPCFLCEWLVLNPYGYIQQYARFDLGYILKSPEQIAQIPRMLALQKLRSPPLEGIWQPIEPERLRQYLGGKKYDQCRTEESRTTGVCLL